MIAGMVGAQDDPIALAPHAVVRVGLREAFAAGFLFMALTFLFAWPLSLRPGSSVLWAGPDTELFMWTLAWDTHALVRQPASLFDANLYAPQQRTLAYSENLLGSALFAAPIIWATGNPVLAMNLVALLSVALCGTGAWLLARRAGIGAAGALLAGMVFAFSPPRFFRTGQLHLGPVQWIPFGLAFLQAYLDGGRARDLRLAIAFFALQALTSGHGAVFLIVASVVLVMYRLPRIVRMQAAPVQAAEPVGFVGRGSAGGARLLRDIGVPGALMLLTAILTYVPYRLVQVEMGLRRPLENWGVAPVNFLASPSHLQRAVLEWLGVGRINTEAEAYLFPGYVPLLLALLTLGVLAARALRRWARGGDAWSRTAGLLNAGLVCCLAVAVYASVVGPIRVHVAGAVLLSARDPMRAWIVCAMIAALRAAVMVRARVDLTARMRRRVAAPLQAAVPGPVSMLPYYAALTGLAVLLSIGPPLGVWPLVYWLPGFNFIRVPSRFTILAMLGLAMLAGAGFDLIRSRVSPRRLVPLTLAAACMLLVDLAAMPLPVLRYRFEIPSIDRWLDTQPKPFTVAELPAADPRNAGALERTQTRYMVHSIAHWQKTVHGYSGIRPPQHAALYADLFSFPSETSLRRLADMHVTYIVVHTDLYAPDEWKRISAEIDGVSDWLTLVYEEPGGRVYTLKRPSS